MGSTFTYLFDTAALLANRGITIGETLSLDNVSLDADLYPKNDMQFATMMANLQEGDALHYRGVQYWVAGYNDDGTKIIMGKGGGAYTTG